MNVGGRDSVIATVTVTVTVKCKIFYICKCKIDILVHRDFIFHAKFARSHPSSLFLVVCVRARARGGVRGRRMGDVVSFHLLCVYDIRKT